MSSGEPKKADAEATKGSRIVWVDLEMTGLDVEKEHIIEMACLITDKDLNIVAEAPNLVIHQPDEVLDAMGAWCKTQHGKSGLTQEVKNSQISLKDAEFEMLQFIKKHTPRGSCPLAGNSVHADRRFLDKYMPSFMDHLHYRIIDVSSIKELCKRWYPAVDEKKPAKDLAHRALDDIKCSIKELEFYRENIFK